MFCNGVKEFLSRNTIEFVERDITADDNAMDELKRLGLMTTPVTVTDGKPIVGFDQGRLKELLELT